MATKRLDLGRWNSVCIGAGGLAWVVVMLLRLTDALTMDDLTAILLLAVFVIVPLALPLAADGSSSSQHIGDGIHVLYRLAILAQPLAALFGSIALFAASGSIIAAVTAILWLLYTAMLGLVGLTTVADLLLKRRVTLSGVCLGLALLYLPIGGAWLALARLGMRPLGFGPTTVLLTAVHFHFITLAALTITGRAGVALSNVATGFVRTLYRIAAVGMLICPLLVAAGITLTQVTGQRVVESVAAVLLALSLALVAALILRFVVPAAKTLPVRALLAISAAALPVTMTLAVVYAVGGATGHPLLTIAQMIAIHGWLNALAFGVCGLLGWRLWMGA